MRCSLTIIGGGDGLHDCVDVAAVRGNTPSVRCRTCDVGSGALVRVSDHNLGEVATNRQEQTDGVSAVRMHAGEDNDGRGMGSSLALPSYSTDQLIKQTSHPPFTCHLLNFSWSSSIIPHHPVLPCALLHLSMPFPLSSAHA